jgi:hypothetical protein
MDNNKNDRRSRVLHWTVKVVAKVAEVVIAKVVLTWLGF